MMKKRLGAEKQDNDSVLTIADISLQPMVEKRLTT
jgi:hypothetical protein